MFPINELNLSIRKKSLYSEVQLLYLASSTAPVYYLYLVSETYSTNFSGSNDFWTHC